MIVFPFISTVTIANKLLHFQSVEYQKFYEPLV